MELNKQPGSNSMHELKQARNMAHAHIDKDSNRALKKVHNDAPGNYNPKIEQLRNGKGRPR